MDIVVEGKASEFFKPDMVKLNLNFYTKTNEYESALKEGTKNVEIFIEEILTKLDFKKDDLKTRSFNVSEVTKYDYEKKQNYKDGFSYLQSATLKFDYDMNILSKFMELVSKLNNLPMYRISFEIKNEEKAKSLVIAKAFAKAEEKAKMIALASGKRLKECIKVDFRPFDEKVISNSNFGSGIKGMDMECEKSTSSVIKNIFTPEDVEISETLYCLWITE